MSAVHDGLSPTHASSFNGSPKVSKFYRSPSAPAFLAQWKTVEPLHLPGQSRSVPTVHPIQEDVEKTARLIRDAANAQTRNSLVCPSVLRPIAPGLSLNLEAMSPEERKNWLASLTESQRNQFLLSLGESKRAQLFGVSSDVPSMNREEREEFGRGVGAVLSKSRALLPLNYGWLRKADPVVQKVVMEIFSKCKDREKEDPNNSNFQPVKSPAHRLTAARH